MWIWISTATNTRRNRTPWRHRKKQKKPTEKPKPTETPQPTAEPTATPTEAPKPTAEPTATPTETPKPTEEVKPTPTEKPVEHVHNWTTGSWVEHIVHPAEYVQCNMCDCGTLFYDENGPWSLDRIHEHMDANGCVTYASEGKYITKPEWTEDITHTYTWCPECYTLKSGVSSDDLPDDLYALWEANGRKKE